MNSSIIIPAHNEAGVISRTLESVLSSNLDSRHTEVIVVASDCTDNTLDVAAAYFAERPTVLEQQYIEAGRGQQTALNAGILAARGETIICLDADVTVDPDTLAAMHQSLKREQATKLVGSLVLYNANELPLQPESLGKVLHAESLRKRSLGVRKSVQGGCLGFNSSDNFLFPESVTPNDVWISAMVADRYGLDSIDILMDKNTYSTPPQNWSDYIALRSRYAVAHLLLSQEYPDLYYTVNQVTDFIEADRKRCDVDKIWQQKCAAEGINLLGLLPLIKTIDRLVGDMVGSVSQELTETNGIWEPITSTKLLIGSNRS